MTDRELLHEVVDYIVQESDLCACNICALAQDNEAVEDDKDPCPHRRKYGNVVACRSGVIGYFMDRKAK